LLLLFGAYLNLHFGSFLPTFSCCFVRPRAGTCFFLTLQQTLGDLTWGPLIVFLKRFFYFSLLVVLIGRAWCGWICPLGFFQDLLDWARRKSGIGFVRFATPVRENLGVIKWVFFFIAVLIPVWVAYPVSYPSVALDLNIPFCQLCPGKYILPIMTGNIDRVTVDFESTTRLVMSSLGLLFSMVVILGALVKRRFWCPYCPLGLLMSWYRKISFLKLKKDDRTCTHCEICANVCPMEIEEVFRSRGKEDVTFADCTLCLKCIEYCPEDDALRAEYLGSTIYRSTSGGFFERQGVARSHEAPGGAAANGEEGPLSPTARGRGDL
jgi:polyferredoxin